MFLQVETYYMEGRELWRMWGAIDGIETHEDVKDEPTLHSLAGFLSTILALKQEKIEQDAEEASKPENLSLGVRGEDIPTTNRIGGNIPVRAVPDPVPETRTRRTVPEVQQQARVQERQIPTRLRTDTLFDEVVTEAQLARFHETLNRLRDEGAVLFTGQNEAPRAEGAVPRT